MSKILFDKDHDLIIVFTENTLNPNVFFVGRLIPCKRLFKAGRWKLERLGIDLKKIVKRKEGERLLGLVVRFTVLAQLSFSPSVLWKLAWLWQASSVLVVITSCCRPCLFQAAGSWKELFPPCQAWKCDDVLKFPLYIAVTSWSHRLWHPVCSCGLSDGFHSIKLGL